LNFAAADPSLTLDLALALLKRRDLPAQVVEQLGKNSGLMKSRKLKLAMVEHPRDAAPSFVARGASSVHLRPDESGADARDSRGHQDRRGRGARLIDWRKFPWVKDFLWRTGRPRESPGNSCSIPKRKIVRAALENPRLTEASIIKVLTRRNASSAFVEAVCRHSKWSLRREIRVALLRNEKTQWRAHSNLRAALPVTLAREILQGSRLPANIKSYVLKDLAQRSGSNGRS